MLDLQVRLIQPSIKNLLDDCKHVACMSLLSSKLVRGHIITSSKKYLTQTNKYFFTFYLAHYNQQIEGF